jgi:hypothetical protein
VVSTWLRLAPTPAEASTARAVQTPLERPLRHEKFAIRSARPGDLCRVDNRSLVPRQGHNRVVEM